MLFYSTLIILGVVLTAIALRKKKSYLAGVGAFSTVTFAIVWPAYHFFSWATLWLLATMAALVWTVSTRSTLSRIAFIVSAGTLTVLALVAGNWVFLFLFLAAILAAVEGLQRTTSTKVLAASAVAAATLFAAVSGNVVFPNIFGTAVAAEAGNPQNLTVTEDDLLPKEVKCATNTFTDNSRKPVGKGGRLWVDSVSTPFTATSNDGRFTELTREICTNPTLGDAYAQALDAAKVGDFSITKANPWLSEFLKKSNTQDGLKVWLYKTSANGPLLVTPEYTTYAEMTSTLLYMLDNQGTHTTPSTTNWPLGALTAGTLPRVYKSDKAEHEPYMALTYTRKGGDKCPFVLGVNVKDKRPEFVSCETAVKVAPKTPTPPRLTVTPPGKGGSTPTPSGTPTKPGHTPSSTPTPTPSHPTSTPCPPGYTGKPGHCLEQKDGKPIPTNSEHTPGTVTESAKPPVHPSQTATTGTAGSESTQKAEGSTPKPKPSETAPHAGNPTSTATACVPDPDSGKTC